MLRHSGIRTLKGCRGLLAPLPGCDSWYVSLPGVRKKRVPLANLLAPLRGAEASVSSATLPFLRVYRAERTLKISKLQGTVYNRPYSRMCTPVVSSCAAFGHVHYEEASFPP